MKKMLSSSFIALSFLLAGCGSTSTDQNSAFENPLTFTPVNRNDQITVPGVGSDCEYKDQSEALIIQFYTYGSISPWDAFLVLDNPGCFNDVVLNKWVSQNSPQGYEYQKNNVEKWMPDGYTIIENNGRIFEGFAQKKLKSGYDCEAGFENCVAVSVVSKEGCPNGISSMMFFTDSKGKHKDKNGYEYPEILLTTESVKSMKPEILIFNTFEKKAVKGYIQQINCFGGLS